MCRHTNAALTTFSPSTKILIYLASFTNLRFYQRQEVYKSELKEQKTAKENTNWRKLANVTLTDEAVTSPEVPWPAAYSLPHSVPGEEPALLQHAFQKLTNANLAKRKQETNPN